jgi:prefoldin alpha subunit
LNAQEKLGELYQSIQYIDQLIAQLQSNLEMLSSEIMVIKQSKDSVDALAKNNEDVIIPLDAKSYSLVKASKVDNERILVRVSTRYYVPVPPAEAIKLLDEEEKRLLKASDEVKQRISELTAERNRLQNSLSALLQKSQGQGKQSTNQPAG